MGYARQYQVSLAETPYYHCVARCVRRAWLCGFDEYAGKDYSHRKQWVIDRLQELSNLFAIDVCDLEWAALRTNAPGAGRIGDDWAIAVEFSVPAPDRFVRDIATFLRNDDGTWRRSDEHHENVLLDTKELPALLAPHGLDVAVGTSFGTETLPVGLRTLIGRRRPA